MDSIRMSNALKKLCPTVDLSDSAWHASSKILQDQLLLVIKHARVLARHARRENLNAEDINQALSLIGHEPVYGVERFYNKRFASVDDRDIFFPEDPDISTTEVTNMMLPRAPADTQIHTHWLAIEGVQPQVPENEPLDSKLKKDPTKKLLLDKEAPNRKRKSVRPFDASFTLFRLTDQRDSGAQLEGMAGSGISLRLPVEHVLTSEQQAYFDQIKESIEKIATGTGEGEDPDSRVENLRHDAALQPLVPYLLQFVSMHVYLSMHQLGTIKRVLEVLRSLVLNTHLDLLLYSHQILPLFLSCLLSEKLGGGSADQVDPSCRVKDLAAKALAEALERFDDSVNNVSLRISQKLADCLEPLTPPIVKYGAIKGLEALGMMTSEAVLQLLKLCLNHTEERLQDISPTTAAYQQGKACVSLIEQIMEYANRDPTNITSPLEKKAGIEDGFI